MAFLNDAKCNEVKNPSAMKTPKQKAAMVFALVLNRVDVDSDALGEFVSVLRKKPKTFKKRDGSSSKESSIFNLDFPALNLCR